MNEIFKAKTKQIYDLIKRLDQKCMNMLYLDPKWHHIALEE